MTRLSILLGLLCACGVKSETTSTSTPTSPPTASGSTNDGWREPAEKRVQCQPATTAEFVGTYDSPEWGTTVLRVVGDEIWGVYAHDEGVLRGRVVDGAFLGWWNEAPSRLGPDDAGEVQFCLTTNAEGLPMIDGSWMYGSVDDHGAWHDDWDMQRTASPAPEELEARFAQPAIFLRRP